MKRIFDLFFALLLLIILSPLLAAAAAAIKVKMGSPVLFRQQRPGLYGETFELYKFRTMTNEKDSKGILLPDHMRLLPLGKFLRKYSLDELPQLFNVIKGNLSLVGPRPLLTDYLKLYTAEQARRHLVKPGITGWAQVNGRNSISWEEKFELDVWYVDHHNLFVDIKILWLTSWRVFLSRDINQNEWVSMEIFKGNEEQEKSRPG